MNREEEKLQAENSQRLEIERNLGNKSSTDTQ